MNRQLEDTWLIAENPNDEKLYLCKVFGAFTEGDDTFLRVKWDHPKISEEDSACNIREDAVKAYLGSDPKPGSVYGIKVEPLFDSRYVGNLVENVHYRRKLIDRQRRIIDGCIEAGINMVAGFDFTKNLDVVVRPGKGTKLGLFVSSIMGQRMELLLTEEIFDSPSDIVRCFVHEIGHKYWLEKMSTRDRIDWVNSFREGLERTEITENLLTELRDKVSGFNNVKDANKALGEGDRKVFAKVVRFIKENYLIDKDVIDGTFTFDEIKDLWPTAISWGEHFGSVTDYGNEDPIEDFCECFSFHVMGLPMNEQNETRIGKCVVVPEPIGVGAGSDFADTTNVDGSDE